MFNWLKIWRYIRQLESAEAARRSAARKALVELGYSRAGDRTQETVTIANATAAELVPLMDGFAGSACRAWAARQDNVCWMLACRIVALCKKGPAAS